MITSHDEALCDVLVTLTPVLFLLVSSREMVKEAARLGELSTSLRDRRHSPRNLHTFQLW